MDIYGIVQGMFPAVIPTEDFVIAPDASGVFLFTEEGEAETATIKATRIMRQLNLSPNEVVICLVVNDAVCGPEGEKLPTMSEFAVEDSLVYCASLDEIDAFILAVVKERGTVLFQAEIEDIIGCYMDLPEVKTDLEGQLMRAGLGEELAGTLAASRPNNLEEVEAAGVTKEDAGRVLKILERQYWREDEASAGKQFVYRGMPVGEEKLSLKGFFLRIAVIVFLLALVYASLGQNVSIFCFIFVMGYVARLVQPFLPSGALRVFFIFMASAVMTTCIVWTLAVIGSALFPSLSLWSVFNSWELIP